MRKIVKTIGIWSWALFLLKWAYELLNHLGNLQTLHDIVSNWPTILKDAALIVGSNWFLPSVGMLSLVLWGILGYRERRPRLQQDSTIPSAPAATEPNWGDPAYDHFWQTREGKAKRADRLAKTISHRITHIEETINADAANVMLMESLNIEPGVAGQLQNAPTPVESIEPELIEEAFALDRDFGWSVFYEIGVAVKRLNERIVKYNELFSSAISGKLREQIQKIRYLIRQLRT